MLRNKILITNDDGVDSPGLLALAIELEKIGDVTILAPDKNWSASGHSRALDRPLRVKEVQLPNGMSAFAADGSPADCVALGVRGFLPFKPDPRMSYIPVRWLRLWKLPCGGYRPSRFRRMPLALQKLRGIIQPLRFYAGKSSRRDCATASSPGSF